MDFVEPHSPHWFYLVEQIDWSLAAWAGTSIAFGRSKNVCTFCSDIDARDFRVKSARLESAAVPSLRLCSTCYLNRLIMGDRLVAAVAGNSWAANPAP